VSVAQHTLKNTRGKVIIQGPATTFPAKGIAKNCIIYTIERFDDATYVRSIVDQLGSFFAASPRWAVIVHMRILNSPPTLAAYADCIKTLPNDKRGVVRKVLEAVRKKNAKFVAPCDSLLAVI
jgi:hypothetical protein